MELAGGEKMCFIIHWNTKAQIYFNFTTRTWAHTRAAIVHAIVCIYVPRELNATSTREQGSAETTGIYSLTTFCMSTTNMATSEKANLLFILWRRVNNGNITKMLNQSRLEDGEYVSCPGLTHVMFLYELLHMVICNIPAWNLENTEYCRNDHWFPDLGGNSGTSGTSYC